MKKGDPVSYQCAGMPEPEHGYFHTDARLKAYAFIDFVGHPRPQLTPRSMLRPGHVGPWLFQNPQGQWENVSERTPNDDQET